jgi:two-component system sensor histidine kinase DegS
MVLVVEDNGRGFDRSVRPSSSDHGIGLLGMQERAAFISAALEIESSPGSGTTVFVRVPLASPTRA